MASLLTKVRLGILAFLLTVAGGLFLLLALLWTLLTHPRSAFKKTRRNVPPACLLDPSLGSHGYVTANGIKFHYVAAGDQSKPLMLFLHGFPEFWFCWRYQMREFSKDYRVVAIEMRGYGETEKPPNVLDYCLDNLRRDIVELVPALGYTKCILVGHDWGGAVGWQVAHHNPEVVEKFVLLNCPHYRVLSKAYQNDLKQVLKSWYMLMFQIPMLPELLLTRRDYSFVDDMLGKDNPAGPKNRDAFTPDVIEAYKYTFSQPGTVTAALNYYRCMFRKPPKQKRELIELPVLIIWGDDDVAMGKELAEQHSMVASNLTIRHIPNCSHWVQHDATDKVNQYIREFLQE